MCECWINHHNMYNVTPFILHKNWWVTGKIHLLLLPQPPMACYLHHLLPLLLLSAMMSNTSTVYSSFLNLTRVATTSNWAATTNIGGLSFPTFTYSITASLLILASLQFFPIHSHFNMHKFPKTNKTNLPPGPSTCDTIVAGYFVPKGSHVLLSRMGLGRNPKVWDGPLKFKPELHLKDGLEVVLVEPEPRFITFSTGRHGCLGVAFGSDLTVMPLARLLQGFSWEGPPAESFINLTESTNDLYLAQPLRTLGKPRLPKHLYPVD